MTLIETREWFALFIKGSATIHSPVVAIWETNNAVVPRERHDFSFISTMSPLSTNSPYFYTVTRVKIYLPLILFSLHISVVVVAAAAEETAILPHANDHPPLSTTTPNIPHSTTSVIPNNIDDKTTDLDMIEKWCENCTAFGNSTFYEYIVYTWQKPKYVCSPYPHLHNRYGVVINYGWVETQLFV